MWCGVVRGGLGRLSFQPRMASASEKLANLQKMGPLDVPIDELIAVTKEAEATGVDPKRILRAQKKAKYAEKVQGEREVRMKEWEEWDKPTLADSVAILESNFGFHGMINYEHNMKMIKQRGVVP